MDVKYFARRRLVNIVALIIAVMVIFFVCRWQANAVHHDSFTTGYILISAVFFLTAYGFRKKIPVLPLGSASSWLQFHIYVGLASVFVFLIHIGFRIPNGIFETVLAASFVLVASSGIFGLYLTRAIPKRISRLPEEYVFERIPRLRHKVGQDAREVVLATAGGSRANVVASFYADELAAFFDRPRETFFYFFPGSRRRRRLMGRLSEIQRYCSSDEKQASERLFGLIRKKDDLDYHFAMQLILKSWLFIHVGLTYSLLVFAILHAAMAHAFRGTV